MTFLVFSEDKELAYQLLAKARTLADQMGTGVAVLAVDSAQDYISQGADKVLQVDGLGEFSVEPYRAAILEAVKSVKPAVVLVGATKRGKELAPRVASALGVGCMTECSVIELEGDKIVVERLTYGGSTVARETCTSTPTVITVPPRSFDKLEPSERSGE
ncbi:electron transfer flavoprotein subunit alpha/FixB family protein, partial [Candidatus Bathyarchaeota archaeon]|nr:electron transfer flavoprotein subunit alpha/FixB family protein [Candidatus Bathyarchaeota archaeon]